MSCKNKIPQDTEKYTPFTGSDRSDKVANSLVHTLYKVEEVANLVECSARNQLVQQLVLGLNRISRRNLAKTKPAEFYSQRLNRCFRFLDRVIPTDKKESWEIISNDVVVAGPTGDRTKPQVNLGFGITTRVQNENGKEIYNCLKEEFDDTPENFPKEEKQRANTMVNNYLTKINADENSTTFKTLYGIPGDDDGPMVVLYQIKNSAETGLSKTIMHVLFSEPTELVAPK